ncbi:MAG: hypothetical protein RLZZ15_4468 [Verrucomicrobiota bacterium]|jgi:hypothetical protein
MGGVNTIPHPRSLHSSRTFRTRLIALAGFAFALVAATLRADTRHATLAAIHAVENPRNVTRPGRCGELGAYQFREATWRMHTAEPFARALDRAASDAVAVRHYEWLRRGLERAGLSPTAYRIALAWNGGLAATVRGSAPRAAHGYAERVANLAAEFAAEGGGSGE